MGETSNEGELNFETVTKWTSAEVAVWLRSKSHDESYIKSLCDGQKIDGKSLLLLTESDLKSASLQFKVLYLPKLCTY